MSERRKRREWEAEFVSEYADAAFKGQTVIFHCRLGTWPGPLTSPDLTEEERRMLRVRMRWADAVVIMPERILVVEGKLRASEFLKGLGELLVYTHLIRVTPEFEKFRGFPVVGRLLLPIPDPVVEAVARSQGLQVQVFRPTFWEEFLEAIQPRQARPIRPEESTLIAAGAKTPREG